MPEINVNRMAVVRVPTNFNIDLEFEIPEFYRRLIALLLDILIEFFYYKIAQQIYEAIWQKYFTFDSDRFFDLKAVGMILALPILLYHIVMEMTMNGQSVGKRIMGLRVVNENGGKASISQYLIRWLLRVSDVWIVMLIFIIYNRSNLSGSPLDVFFYIGGALIFLIVDIALVVSSQKGQRIGDMLAHTIVIRTNPSSSIEETVFQEVEDNYVPAFPQIMQLSDKDINAIKSIVETEKRRGDGRLATGASERIKAHLQIESHLQPLEFLETLLKDYNYLSTK